MFYYCARCASVENINVKAGSVKSCTVCGNVMEPVPTEYLMPNGTFFKSGEERERLILNIKATDTYDETIGNAKEEIKKQKEKEEQEHINIVNQKMRENQFKLTCPICGSSNIQKISTAGKYAKVYAFGLLGADSLGKRWKCNVCGSKF